MNVLDFNDNTPVIKIAKFDLRMPSDARVGYVFFGFFTAVDADYNDTLTYRTMGKYATSEGRKEERKDMFYLTTHPTHFIYGYMAADITGKGPLR